ncbi:MAG: Pr6Pr family membrane protein [Clostridiales bacterium]|nr:Pr6Pr family membrane protein [Clostridiales bacterium]
MGVFDGEFHPSALLYYTSQSNVLCLVWFGLLLARSLSGIKTHGKTGPSSYNERFSALVALSITVTMAVFWTMLAPTMDPGSLWTFRSLQPHLFTPLLVIADYLLFASPGKLTSRDPLYSALVPLGYWLQATVLGLSGVVYRTSEATGAAVRFPYFFIDYDQIGWMVAVYVVAIALFFFGIAWLLLWSDRRRAGAK